MKNTHATDVHLNEMDGQGVRKQMEQGKFRWGEWSM